MFLEYHQHPIPLYLQPSIVYKTRKPLLSVKETHYPQEKQSMCLISILAPIHRKMLTEV